MVTSSESSGHVPYVTRDRMRSNRSSAANLGSMPLRKTPSYCPLSMIRSVTGTKEYSNSSPRLEDMRCEWKCAMKSRPYVW